MKITTEMSDVFHCSFRYLSTILAVKIFAIWGEATRLSLVFVVII